MVGKLVSFWEALFSGAMLVSGRYNIMFQSKVRSSHHFISPYPFPKWNDRPQPPIWTGSGITFTMFYVTLAINWIVNHLSSCCWLVFGSRLFLWGEGIIALHTQNFWSSGICNIGWHRTDDENCLKKHHFCCCDFEVWSTRFHCGNSCYLLDLSTHMFGWALKWVNRSSDISHQMSQCQVKCWWIWDRILCSHPNGKAPSVSPIVVVFKYIYVYIYDYICKYIYIMYLCFNLLIYIWGAFSSNPPHPIGMGLYSTSLPWWWWCW